jgi:large subunit ribosomal protein L22
MLISAQLNDLRIAPRKVRVIADLIRGKRVIDAERALRFTTRRGAPVLAKLLSSAVANAKKNYLVEDVTGLRVREIRVDGGSMLKRTSPRAMGRAAIIRKRTSHITLILEASGVAAPVKHEKPSVEVLQEGEVKPEVEGTPVKSERPDAETHVKKTGKSSDFVRRVFRRKAI